MRRALAGILVLLTAIAAFAADGVIRVPPDSTGKQLDTSTMPGGEHRQRVNLGDPVDRNRLAHVNASGQLEVSCTGCTAASVVAVTHVSSVTHVAAASAFPVTQSGAWTVNVQHISGAVHLAGSVVDDAKTALRVTGVTVFTIMGAVDHISSVTHVIGSTRLINQAGTVATFTGTALDVNCAGCAASSTVVVSHVSSVTHVAAASPFPVVQSPQQGPWAVTAHAGTGSFTVNQGGAWALTTHVGTGSRTVNQSGSWIVTAHQGSSAWTVAHVSAQMHVTVGRATSAKMSAANCGAGASTVLQSNTSRRRLVLQSAGTAHIAVGFGHVTVTMANGWLLYSPANFPAAGANSVSGLSDVSKLDLDGYTGRVDCIGAGANQRLNILELIGD